MRRCAARVPISLSLSAPPPPTSTRRPDGTGRRSALGGLISAQALSGPRPLQLREDALVEGDDLQRGVDLPHAMERGEVDCVERAQAAFGGGPPREITDFPGDFDKVHFGPEGLQLPLEILEALGFPRVIQAEAQNGSLGLNPDKAGSQEARRRPNPLLCLFGPLLLEEHSQQRRSLQKERAHLDSLRRASRSFSEEKSFAWIFFAKPFQPAGPSVARVASPRSARASSASSRGREPVGCRLAGRSSATTSSRSVTKMVSPALASRTY